MAIQNADIDLGAPIPSTLHSVAKVAIGAMRHGPEFLRSLEQVPGAIFRRRLVNARRSIIAFIQQLLEARREELRVTDLGLAAFLVVSAAEGIGANASDGLFEDKLADEVATLMTLYLTGEKVRGIWDRSADRDGTRCQRADRPATRFR